MCLAIPVKSRKSMAGRRAFRAYPVGGITRQACLDFVPEANVGDYVMVHVGFAISVVDKDEAERTYALLESMASSPKSLLRVAWIPLHHEVPGRIPRRQDRARLGCGDPPALHAAWV